MVGFPDVCKRQEAAPRRWMKLRVLAEALLVKGWEAGTDAAHHSCRVEKKGALENWKFLSFSGILGKSRCQRHGVAIETPLGGSSRAGRRHKQPTERQWPRDEAWSGWHLPLSNGMACWKSWIKNNWRGWRHLILFFHNRCRSLLDAPNCLFRGHLAPVENILMNQDLSIRIYPHIIWVWINTY